MTELICKVLATQQTTLTYFYFYLNVDNYYVSCINATKRKNVKKGRFSGGLAVIIKQEIRKFIKVVKKCTYGVWLKIDKSTLNTEKDLFVVGIYLPPSDSQYAFKAPYEQMEKYFSNFLAQGNILTLGDLNARTGNLKDYLM